LNILTREQRIQAFTKLGNWFEKRDLETIEFVVCTQNQNPWYTSENIEKQFHALAINLTEDKLTRWLEPYPDFITDKSVGLILAGNLPLVGFHDILCTLVLGFTAKIKVSSDDAGLTEYVLHQLVQIEPAFQEQIQVVEKLGDYDLTIATGSNNSARYFEYYFGKKPHIIRKNRNSIAVLTGMETNEELARLGNDIFDYFGLGCRSVSKLYFPEEYDISLFFEAIEEKKDLKNHFKYNNNYDYNKSVYLINKNKHYDNGFLLLKEDTALTSPLAVLHYEEYKDIKDVVNRINLEKEFIQCVVCKNDLAIEVPCVLPGESQCRTLGDYADGVNTLEFLYKNR